MAYIDEYTHFNELKRSILYPQDIVISIAGTLGKTAIIDESNLPLNTNQAVAFARLIDFSLILPLYICYCISSTTINNLLLSKTKVTSIPNLTLEHISNCLVPIPPLGEQQRICTLLYKIYASIKEMEESLN